MKAIKVCGLSFTDEERQEFFQIANQVFSDEYIADYIKKNGTLEERLAALKAKYKQNQLEG